ncbi:2-amino-3-ketobutyrate coenzyme A ligase [Austwickia chelonae]|uniref:2-amino-3-ketobutyrate coenzyme A ligase n=1 Tax=Austwickia chelonae NBRC 105200 TaxID=1184607 RepID=K6ULC2_9MICO|nr:glycine C-acetyltransferase [Austwickia chelonae]GAB77121.1 2-amino-3-ketobutyrate coenzyme A ligase [Austwickia chelonae NBRC 105200]SEW03251.1 2-amino-3-ketobutyrate coenzyme A ligase [Austwickia chelonae]
MYGEMRERLTETLTEIDAAGLYKHERRLATPQSAHIETVTTDGRAPSLNFCANNYLGLADHPDVIAAAKASYDTWGFGMASVRFICGTQELHKQLEASLSDFLGMQDTILFSSCFDANGGVFEVLFSEEDAIVSDELNHASLIDGIRLCKARRFRYRNRDIEDLRTQLDAARDGGARQTVIVTDGVFSMDGYYAPLPQICDLAEEYGALVLVDDSHAVGFVGAHGRGTHELFDVMDRVDIITGTLGKALGGASGGYVSGPQEVIDLLRQRARPYLFSNAVAPAVAAGSLTAIELARSSDDLRAALETNKTLFRSLMTDAGFDLLPGEHAIVPVMFPGEDGARLAGRIAESMLGAGVYVIPFSYPVVPKGKARIRVQLSAAHSPDDVRTCVAAFVAARDEAAAG